MKRVGNLYRQICTDEALFLAYQDAAKNKHATRACHEFTRRLGSNLAELHESLKTGSYQPLPYYTFEVYEPKRRTIYAPAFRDCVVQHAIYRVVRPVLDRTFIDQSYACRIGKGTHAAADYAQHAMQQTSPDSYVLQLDIKRFFYSIDRDVLRRHLARHIKDASMLDLMMLFADHGEPRGIPIGNLLSQLYALVYLSPMDHYIKRVLGARWYCRYVDDFVLFGLPRDKAVQHRAEIVEWLDEHLDLELSKSRIAKTRRGINFVGYRTWASARFVRRRCLGNFRQALRTDHADRITSLLAHARRTHSHRYLAAQLEDHHAAL